MAMSRSWSVPFLGAWAPVQMIYGKDIGRKHVQGYENGAAMPLLRNFPPNSPPKCFKLKEPVLEVMTNMPIYNANLLRINAKETRRYAGLRKAENFDEALIEEACAEALLLAEPRGIWQRYGYLEAGQLLAADPPLAIEGAAIGSHLAGCDQAVVLAVTVGEAIEQAVTRHFDEGNYAYAVLLDAAATAAVEQAADALEKAIRPQLAREGYAMRWRFSPGYGDWPLRQQPELLRVTRAAEIGIRLSDSLMLLPRKSITAILPLARAAACAGKQTPHGCAICPQRDCPSRRE